MNPEPGCKANPISPVLTVGLQPRLAEANPDLLVLLFRIGMKRAGTVQEVLEMNLLRQSFGPIGRRAEEEGEWSEKKKRKRLGGKKTDSFV